MTAATQATPDPLEQAIQMAELIEHGAQAGFGPFTCRTSKVEPCVRRELHAGRTHPREWREGKLCAACKAYRSAARLAMNLRSLRRVLEEKP